MSASKPTIGVAQIACQVGQVSHNLETISASIREAARNGCDLVVLPEMVDTGYDMDAIKTHASPIDGTPAQTIAAVAQEAGVHVICGISERQESHVYNAAFIANDQGQMMGRYHKTHLFSLVNEEDHLESGDVLAVVEMFGLKFGVIICYDIRFPELARTLALDGMDCLVVIAAWPSARIAHLKALAVARAVENQVYAVIANRVGTDTSLEFGGSSRILAPDGTLLAEASPDAPELITTTLEPDTLHAVRASMAIFDDRRPDLYDI
ncbi:MAG: nitrilase-related carbon-nitrogen hydrolase [Phycisphaerae bacterium]